MDSVVARRRVTERIGRGASVSLPIMVRPLASERLGQDDVLPDIAKVSEMRVRHAAHEFTSGAALIDTQEPACIGDGLRARFILGLCRTRRFTRLPRG